MPVVSKWRIALRSLSKLALAGPGAESTVDSQGKQELNAVRDFLAGRTSEASVPLATDQATRQLIAAELLAAMAIDNTGDSTHHPDPVSATDTDPGPRPGEQPHSNRSDQEQQLRARTLFMDHGYFEEAVQNLRDAVLPQQRAEAARAVGVVRSERGTPHLIAAMFDDDPEVRNAAEEALAQMGGPTTPSVQGNVQASDQRDLEETIPAEASSIEENVAAEEMTSHELTPPDRAEDTRLGSSQDKDPDHQSSVKEDMDSADLSSHSSAGSGEVVESDETLQQATQAAALQGNQPATTEADQGATQETPPAATDDGQASNEPDQLLLQEQALREAAEQLERQLGAAALSRTELEKEVVLSIEREARFRAEAATRWREDEELRKRADEEAEIRRSSEREALKAEQITRMQAETEAHWLAEEESRTRMESIKLRKTAAEVVWQRIGIENARREAAEAARIAEAKSSRDDAQLRYQEELARLSNEEEALRAATEEAATRRADVEKVHEETKTEVELLTKERVELAAAEAVRHSEATRLRQEAKTRHEAEVTRLRSEEEALRAVAEQVARQRAEVGAAQQQAEGEIERLTNERAQLATAEAARRAESDSIREAEAKNRAAHDQLRHELEGLRLVAQEVATRRGEIESARKKADEDAARMLETQDRIRAEEEANARLESERLNIEADLHQLVKKHEQQLDAARRRAQDEQQRLEVEARSQLEHEEKLRAELAQLRKNAEMMAQQRVEEEKQVRNQVDSLRIADAEARKRIEEAEARRRKSEDVYRLVAEKVQRVEAEAHLRASEEQQIMAKLESVRRSAAVEAQARADQEKRIKEEIEQFRRLEEVERPRLEVAALQRTQAQGLLQQQRDRNHAEGTQPRANGLPVDEASPLASADEEPARLHGLVTPDDQKDTVEQLEASQLTDEAEAEAIDVEDQQPGLTATIQTYLTSVDPYKRAAAVAELARSDAKEAFDLIVKCFDDPSPHVRNAAARALRKLEPNRTVDLFNRALEEGSDQRKRNIGSAIAASGLAGEAIDNLVGDNREETYNALLILFVMAKAGEVQPLVKAIEDHPNVEVCKAVIKLLTLTGQTKLGDEALQRRVTGGSAARRMADGLDQLGTVKDGL